MWKYAALISYRGTAYCGWQKQLGNAAHGDPAIQTTIEEALTKVTTEETSVVGSGRTDSGVHSVGQVAHFVMKKKEWKPYNLMRGLNWALPADIRVVKVVPVPIEFHAQRSAVRKQYSYYFGQGPCPLPHLTPFSWWIYKRLDTVAMQEALDHLKGEHDFKAFQAAGSKTTTSVRTILEADVLTEKVAFPGGHAGDWSFVRIRLVGTGFLKQMVRGIAGTLLEIGEERRKPSAMLKILEAKERKLVGATAPGRGLWLERVWYEPSIDLTPSVD